jgi:methylmalonyl-CoA mutase C-terminal domain/subunit
MTIFPKVLDLLKENEIDDVLLIGGGVIPEEDMEELKKMGVAELFGPGTPTTKTIDYIENWFKDSQRNA